MKISTEFVLREKLSCAAFCYSMDANVNSNSFSNLQFRFLTNFLLRVFFNVFVYLISTTVLCFVFVISKINLYTYKPVFYYKAQEIDENTKNCKEPKICIVVDEVDSGGARDLVFNSEKVKETLGQFVKIFETFSPLSISMPSIIDFKHYKHDSHNLLKHL